MLDEERKREEADKGKRDTKSAHADKKKNEYLERECQMLRDKYEALKTNATLFEQATHQMYTHY